MPKGYIIGTPIYLHIKQYKWMQTPGLTWYLYWMGRPRPHRAERSEARCNLPRAARAQP